VAAGDDGRHLGRAHALADVITHSVSHADVTASPKHHADPHGISRAPIDAGPLAARQWWDVPGRSGPAGAAGSAVGAEKVEIEGVSKDVGTEELYGEQAKRRGFLPSLVLVTALLLLVACSGPRRGFRTLNSPEQAQDLVSFPVLMPDPEALPAGLELQEVGWKHDREQDAEIVALVYRGPGMELGTEQFARDEARLGAPNEAHERVTVRGTTGYLFSHPAGEPYSLAWEENGTIVSVSSSGLTLEQTLRIVQSMSPVGK
jgi:hypothetical protein